MSILSEKAENGTHLIMTTGAPGVTGLLACQRMTDAKYNARSIKNNFSDIDILASSDPTVQGGSVVAYDTIDAGTQNVRRGTGVAKRQDGGDDGRRL